MKPRRRWVFKAAQEQAQAEIMAVEAKYVQASQDLKRYQRMAQSNTISPQQLDHAVTAIITAGPGSSTSMCRQVSPAF